MTRREFLALSRQKDARIRAIEPRYTKRGDYVPPYGAPGCYLSAQVRRERNRISQVEMLRAERHIIPAAALDALQERFCRRHALRQNRAGVVIDGVTRRIIGPLRGVA